MYSIGTLSQIEFYKLWQFTFEALMVRCVINSVVDDVEHFNK